MKMILMIFLTMAATQAFAGGVQCQLDNSCPGWDTVLPKPPEACVQYTKNYAYESTLEMCQPRYGSYFSLIPSSQKNTYVWSVEFELCAIVDIVVKTDDQCNIISSEVQSK
jgi:hypothetical protein